MLKANEIIKTFRDYKIVRQIGQGGNGTVFECICDDKPYALKIINRTDTNTEKNKRFKNEIHACKNFDHPNIIKVFDYGDIEKSGKDFVFYVMPKYTKNLRELMNEGFDDIKKLEMFLQICDGLEYVHNSKCFHRDLKPENILYAESQVAICDFGIAHFSENDKITEVETKDTARLANFTYRAPEQLVKGAKCDEATDIYALGLILNEMFTGTVISGSNYKKIGSINNGYAFLDGIIDKMVSQDSKERYKNIAEVRADIIAHIPNARANIAKIENEFGKGNAVVELVKASLNVMSYAEYEALENIDDEKKLKRKISQYFENIKLELHLPTAFLFLKAQ